MVVDGTPPPQLLLITLAPFCQLQSMASAIHELRVTQFVFGLSEKGDSYGKNRAPTANPHHAYIIIMNGSC